MLGFSVDHDRCLRDGLCLSVCSRGALQDDGEGCPTLPEENVALCNACGQCSAICPVQAVISPKCNGEAAALLDPKLAVGSDAARQFLLSCRSVRQFKKQDVPREEILELLDVARRAPSGSNAQPVRWIAVSGAEKMRRISELTVEWFDAVVRHDPSATPGYSVDYIVGRFREGYDVILRGAPNAVIAVADRAKARNVVETSIALTYFCLAAHAKNIGSCWAGFAMRAADTYAPLREYLGLATEDAVHGIVFFGYPDIAYAALPPRKPLRVAWL